MITPFEAIKAKKEAAREVNRGLWEKAKGRIEKSAEVLGGAAKGAAKAVKEVPTIATATILAAPEIADWVKSGVQAGVERTREGIEKTKAATKEKFGQAKNWFQRQFEAIKTGAATAVEFGQSKKEQLVNLAKAGRDSLLAKAKNARDGLVNNIGRAVDDFKERIRDAKTRKELERLSEELEAAEAQLAALSEKIEKLTQQKAEIEAALGLL